MGCVGRGWSRKNARRIAVAAVVGGTVSSLSGGDFANGAYTAAFQHLFNEEFARFSRGNPNDLVYETDDGRKLTALEYEYYMAHEVGSGTKDPISELYLLTVGGGVSSVKALFGGLKWAGGKAFSSFTSRFAPKTADKFRRTPNNLAEKLTMDEAKGGAGKKIMSNLNDPKFKGMDKMQHVHKHPNGTQTNIHFVKDPKTGKTMDFKFKEYDSPMYSNSA